LSFYLANFAVVISYLTVLQSWSGPTWRMSSEGCSPG